MTWHIHIRHGHTQDPGGRYFEVDANPKISISIQAAWLSSEVRDCKIIDFRIKRHILLKLFAPAAREGRLRRGADAGS